jgi:uncharacterized protein YgiB involved in biofilm formation
MHTIAKRKRSRVVGLTVLGLTGLAAGCDPGPSDEELSAREFGAPQEVQLYSSVNECIAKSGLSIEDCRIAEQKARQESLKYAPRFDSQALCEEQYGASNCIAQTANNQSFFMPLLTGFLIGQALDFDRPSRRYVPVYLNSRDGLYYTGSGAWLYSHKGAAGPNSYRIGTKGLEKPIAAPRVQNRATVVSRGGFGGRATASNNDSFNKRATASKSGGWGRGG